MSRIGLFSFRKGVETFKKQFLQIASLIIVMSLALSLTAQVGASPAINTAQADLTFNALVTLSSNDITWENPTVTYVVDFHQSFVSISEIDFYFTFENDLLDQGEMLMITGDFPGGYGFVNPNPTPQSSRFLRVPCTNVPNPCSDFFDGFSQGEITISQDDEDFDPSVRVSSMFIYVIGSVNIDATIDIKPGSDENPINLKSAGTIPVAILSTPDFDATTMIDETSLTFGKTGREQSLAFCNDDAEDVNGDGLPDQICHFYTQLTNLNYHLRSATLRGLTTNGVKLAGSDSITIVNY